MQTGNIETKFAAIDEHWRPKVIANLNDHEVKLVKVRGVFPWHAHESVDEMFLVWKGRFRVEFRDRSVDMAAGEFVVVPRGVEHRTAADDEAEVMIFEPRDVRNTGDVLDEFFTAPSGVAV